MGISVKIKWQNFTAQTMSNGTWRSNSLTLEELLNNIASSEKIMEPTQDIEHSMAHLAINNLPYFKIVEITYDKLKQISSDSAKSLAINNMQAKTL